MPADCATDFVAVADGCVTDSPGANQIPDTWGSATVQHIYFGPYGQPWTSQYGHSDKIYYSVGSGIAKGAVLGSIGNVGRSTGCHLHFEIRESDHPNPTDADAYYNSSKAVVGDYYQDPESFIAARPASGLINWWRDEDEDPPYMTYYGAWSYTTGVGDQGDDGVDDLRYASTTSVSSKTTYVCMAFGVTAGDEGTYTFSAFVPYTYRTSTAVPYTIVNSSTGHTVFSTTVNQSIYEDAWVRLGQVYLPRGDYYLEVSTNTGESDKLVSVDDFLVVGPSSLADLSPTAILYNPADLVHGRTVYFDSGIQNAGSQGTVVFNIRWFVDDVSVGYGGHSGVPANSTVLDGNSQYSWPATAGTHTIRFVVDSDNHVSESNESNNSLSVTVSVP